MNRLSTRSPFLLLASRTGIPELDGVVLEERGERCYVAFLRLLLVLFLRVLFLVAGFFGSGAGAGAFVVSGLGFGEGFGGGGEGWKVGVAVEDITSLGLAMYPSPMKTMPRTAMA